MKRCYYAHPITDYGSPVERMDIEALAAMGFEVVNPNTPELDRAYKDHGMAVFVQLVQECDLLAFRSFEDGGIPAGVAKEIDAANKVKMPIFEMPRAVFHRGMSVEATRAKLKQLGRK